MRVTDKTVNEGQITMFMPDYGTVQLLYEDRLRDIERSGRSLTPFFEKSRLPGHLFAALGRWLHRTPAQVTRYKPAHQKG